MTWLVVGLGEMGQAFTRRLVACGEDVVGVDPVPTAREGLEDLGSFTAMGSIVEVGPVEQVIVMVRSPTQVVEVLGQMDAISAEKRQVPVFVSSTIDPATARRLGDWNSAAYRVVEAPVTGLARGALDGVLTIMIAGGHTDADRGLLLRTLARRVIEFEQYGQPTLAKLFNNCLLSYNSHALAAVLRIAVAEGLPPAALMEVLAEGSGGSFAATSLFTTVPELIDKDVGLLVQAIGELPAVRPGIAPVARDIMDARGMVSERGPDVDCME
jgi:3-hydroxyisobutyrate dehydrogenase-like beta-hydroxyacid dehydrogenase